MTRPMRGGLHDLEDYEDESFVFVNDSDDTEERAWVCPKCGRFYVNKVDDIVGSQKRHDDSFHRRHKAGRAPGGTVQSPASALEKIPPHIILRYAHRLAASSRNVSDFYKVLSEFYEVPVPRVESVPKMGYENGRKVLGAWRENTIRFPTSPSFHTIMHEYFHYYSYVISGGKTGIKSATCKTLDDARKEEFEANDFADRCVIAFEKGSDYKEEFRDLAFRFHPDRGGSPRVFKLVKTAYDYLVAPPPSPAPPQTYSYSPPPSYHSTQSQQERDYIPNSQQQHSRKAKRAELRGKRFFFSGIFLRFTRALHWRSWNRKKNRRNSRSDFTRFQTARWITSNRIAFLIKASILLADGFVLAFLAQGVLSVHYFPQSDYFVLQVCGALAGAGTVMIGLGKTRFSIGRFLRNLRY